MYAAAHINRLGLQYHQREVDINNIGVKSLEYDSADVPKSLSTQQDRDDTDDSSYSNYDDDNNESYRYSSVLSFISQYQNTPDEYEESKEVLTQNIKHTSTSPVSSPKFRLTFGSIREALNRPRNSRHIKMLSELNLSIPEANEPIIFESKVANLHSPTFKKSSKNHLILTRKCLCQFKNAEKAAKIFDGLPLCTLPPKSPDVSGPSSSPSLPVENVILALATVFAVTESLTPNPHIRLDYISSPKKPSFVSITAPDLQKHQQWLITLRPAIRNTDPIGPYLNSSQRMWIMKKLRLLDDLADENEEKLVSYRALLKSITDEGKIDSNDKEPCVPVLFVLGRSNIYIVLNNMSNNGVLNEDSRRSKDFKFEEKQSTNYPLLIEDIKRKEINLRKYQYPLLCLTDIRADGHDDTFHLTFKDNVGSKSAKRTFVLSSLLYKSIINDIRAAIDSITFWWPNPSYRLQISASASNSPSTSLSSSGKDRKSMQKIGIERMIEAQLHAYRIPKARVSFRVDYVLGAEGIVLGKGIEHLPFRFTLLPPKGEKSDEDESYSNFELLAVFNSLQHHPLLYEVVFRNINLFELQIHPGPMNRKGANMLAAAIYDLLTSNPELQKLDLTSCGLTGETVAAIGDAMITGGSALEKLLIGNNSVTREGIQALASGLTSHGAILKELDLSNCKLTHESIEVLLNALDTLYPDRLEVLNLSDNTCNLETNVLSDLLSRTVNLRSLSLRNCVNFFFRPNKIISFEILEKTHLTTLDIGRVSLSIRDHLHALYEYIKSPAFSKMKYFIVDHCNLDGESLAIILSYISTSPNNESIRVWAGGNHVTRSPSGCKEFCNAVRNDWTPTWLSMEDTIFGANSDEVVEILTAFAENTVLKFLDLSYPQFRVSQDFLIRTQHKITAKKACEVIGFLLSNNNGLKELNLLGDPDRKWGSSLGAYLTALGKNEVLERLNVKGNATRDQGAIALSEALKLNVTLQFLNIDENEISIDGYKALHQVITTHKNVSLRELVYPKHDLQIYHEVIDTKLSIRSRDTIFGSSTIRSNQRIASEKQKNEFKLVLDEIMIAIEQHSKVNHNNIDEEEDLEGSEDESIDSVNEMRNSEDGSIYSVNEMRNSEDVLQDFDDELEDSEDDFEDIYKKFY
ncbi:12646_t:CDS:2 [Acaulospora morrowiae]|uniref:12646_t:CDS:1 n=1 Tax=Acaulospora morrowiae TaxID=94023 RepID=A0A9N9C3N4_9GLOM|nr:12646_t:CDS:2 [Acaulospora morrowiae]